MLPISVLDPITPQAASMSSYLPAMSSFASPSSASTAAASSSSGSSSSSSSSTGPDNELNGDDFITLLAAQLQAQDPLNPIDPTTFVTQLVQFNQLQQLIDINQTLSPSTAAAQNAAASTAAQNLATQLSSAVPATSIF